MFCLTLSYIEIDIVRGEYMLNIKTDSRKVKPGDTFIALKGYTVDGHDYIEEALQKGATKVISNKEMAGYPEVEVVPDTKVYLEEYLKTTYSKEFKDLKVVGITGTNGKTTTCYLVYQMLQKLQVPVAMIGTLGFYSPNCFYTLQNTTPDILTLYNLFLKAKEDHCKVVVMEVSSHALDQKRIYGIGLDVACFTNLSLDHLDYHGTMHEYLLAKVKIMEYLKEEGVLVVNKDDKHCQAFRGSTTIEVGYHGKDYQILRYYMAHMHTQIIFKSDKKYMVTTSLQGKFNVYNYMMSLAIVTALGYKQSDCLGYAKDLHAPLGRCSQYAIKKGTVIVDYAHTPDAIKKMITAFSEHKKGRVITVVGCGGNRDVNKRPIIGEIATKYSNYAIFTNDNPRFEDPKEILKQMTATIFTKNYEVIEDRKEAIFRAIDLMAEDDVVLILGKGHEEYQIINGQKIPYSDLKEVEKYN